MEESTGRMAELQEELARKDEQIAQLSQDITSLALEAEQQSAVIRDRISRSTAYYVLEQAGN